MAGKVEHPLFHARISHAAPRPQARPRSRRWPYLEPESSPHYLPPSSSKGSHNALSEAKAADTRCSLRPTTQA